MRRNFTKTAATLILAVVFTVAVGAGVAAAPPWPDAPDSWWTSSYGVTDAQVGVVADGFDDGTFRPSALVSRGQFAKMAVSGLDLPALDPITPAFQDVAKGSTFYEYVEGAAAEGIINGYDTPSGKYFRPGNTVSRQQTNSILGRYLSEVELAASGVIHGVGEKTYGSLQEWYLWEGAFYIEGFLDYSKLAQDHKAATAFLVFHEVVEGSGGYLRPTATLNRAQAAVLILRVAEAAKTLTTAPKAPILLRTIPSGEGVGRWCTDPTPLIEGTAVPLSEVYVFNAEGETWIAAGYADSTGHVSLRVETPLFEGMHNLVARVRSTAGLFSSASNTLSYGVDTVAPAITITRPLDAGVFYTDSHSPPFLADASDEGSGVVRVDFFYALWNEEGLVPTWDDFTLLSSGTAAPYEAEYPADGLENGRYVFAVRAVDLLGNESVLLNGDHYASGVAQEVIINDDPGL